MGDFDIKLQQKNIEQTLKLNKQKEKMEKEKRDLIQKYEALIASYSQKEEEKKNDIDDEKESTHSTDSRPSWTNTKNRHSVDGRFQQNEDKENEKKKKKIGNKLMCKEWDFCQKMTFLC